MTTAERAQRAIEALRAPDYTLARVPNTIRQSIAEVIEELLTRVDRFDTYGLALMMIREGCTDPASIARDALERATPKQGPAPEYRAMLDASDTRDL